MMTKNIKFSNYMIIMTFSSLTNSPFWCQITHSLESKMNFARHMQILSKEFYKQNLLLSLNRRWAFSIDKTPNKLSINFKNL